MADLTKATLKLGQFSDLESRGDQPKVKGAVATPAVPHPPQIQLSQLHDHITWEHRDRRFLKRRSAACAGSPLVWRAPLFQKAPRPAMTLPSRGVSSHHPSPDTPLETIHMKFGMEFYEYHGVSGVTRPREGHARLTLFQMF